VGARAEAQPARLGLAGPGFVLSGGHASAMLYSLQHFCGYDLPLEELKRFHTYVFCGDGDPMEGIASEAASHAGHLGLGKLVCLYDDNQATIEGGTELVFTEDVARRFAAYGGHVLRVKDGNDCDAIQRALEEAKVEAGKPP
jgi:transketolase